jgi:cytochrome oxidase Cu insertion factor (SCO1/SenC/PrrC family)
MNRMRLGLVLVLAAMSGVLVGVAIRVADSGAKLKPALTKLHGQATWSPRERPAPGFRLRDQDGRLVSLGQLRGRPVLLTFFDSHCDDQCPIAGHQLGHILNEMPEDERPAVVVVSVNPRGDTPPSIRHAMAHWHLDGTWPWHWLRGTERELGAVWKAFGVTVQPTTHDVSHGLPLYLIDRRGYSRTGYLFPFLPNFVALDLRSLAHERT